MAAIVDHDKNGYVSIIGMGVVETAALGAALADAIEKKNQTVLEPIARQLLGEITRINDELERASIRLEVHLEQALKRHAAERSAEQPAGQA